MQRKVCGYSTDSGSTLQADPNLGGSLLKSISIPISLRKALGPTSGSDPRTLEVCLVLRHGSVDCNERSKCYGIPDGLPLFGMSVL